MSSTDHLLSKLMMITRFLYREMNDLKDFYLTIKTVMKAGLTTPRSISRDPLIIWGLFRLTTESWDPY